MRKTKITAILLAGIAGVSTYAFASGWDLALDAAESASLRTTQSGNKMPVAGVVSSSFGLRKHPVTEKIKQHNGIDIAAAEGTEFLSTSVGRVTFAGDAGSLGLMVEVKALDGTVTRFGHASALTVKAGDRIHKGTVLGRVGSTGLATGSHLHYELIVNGSNVDPAGGDLSGLLAKTEPAPSVAKVALAAISIGQAPTSHNAIELKEEQHNAALIASIVNVVQMETPSVNEKHQPSVLKPAIEYRLAKLVPFKKQNTFKELKRTAAIADSTLLLPKVDQIELRSDLDKEIQSAIYAVSV